MITPRASRLVRLPGLRALQAYLSASACADPALSRATAVIVPSRGAAEELRRTIENRGLLSSPDGPRALVLPDLLTRSELYLRLHESLPGAPRLLSEFEREVIFRRAARVAGGAGAPAPFRLRAGLVVQILAFYDELRRRDRSVAAFDRLMTGSLEPSAAIDRGAERMLRQTGFLAAAFAEFEGRVAASGAMDEHGLRARLIAGDSRCPYRRVIVTVADQAADPRGLWLADYDLLARVPGLERLDVAATEEVLASGFHQRLHDVLPGIEEERVVQAIVPPVLVVPPREAGAPAIRWFVCRDREDELADSVRALKHRPDPPALDRTAIVFQRPLPYLYLARQVFASGGVPYQTLDALPLAAEPFAAAIDLILAFAGSEGNRASLVELLRSPHWRFSGPGGQAITWTDAAAADRYLRESKYAGGWERLASLAGEQAALAAANGAALALQPVWSAPRASEQLAALIAFIRAHERLPHAGDAGFERHLRARAAILSALEDLRAAHLAHDDEPLGLAEVAGDVRRWIEGQTFSPRTGSRGVRLIDATAAPFADVDEVRLVGLVESDWPERSVRSIFYPSSLLSQLGWPADRDRLTAARARFQDLLTLPSARLSVSTFTLEDDAIVPPSPFLEELETSTLALEISPPRPAARVFVHEALSARAAVAHVLGPGPGAWLALRSSRSAPGDDRFHGETGARAPGEYAVSSVERYLDCPFKYFAAHVLRLQEERDDQSGLTPQERGQFLHSVFEQFFTEWRAAGRRAITTANFDDARAMFARVAEARLAALGETDRALERNYLLGSAASPGLAARAFAFEVEQGTEVLDRLLEHKLEGEFTFEGARGPRQVRIRAKADRIDLLEDGTLRIIDYKLSRAPKPARALQLPVYGACARQRLEGHLGRSWVVSSAGYVAFRDRNAFTALGASSSLQDALAAGQERFLAAIDAIEAGTFPPRPDEPFICTRCGYAPVCRKDYVGDE